MGVFWLLWLWPNNLAGTNCSASGKFNQLVYNYPIRIPERFSLVIRSLLTQEGICFTLQPDFKFLEVNASPLLLLLVIMFLCKRQVIMFNRVWS